MDQGSNYTWLPIEEFVILQEGKKNPNPQTKQKCKNKNKNNIY